MGRRRTQQSRDETQVENRANDADAASDDWTLWRPRPKPFLLDLTVLLLLAWVGFLLAMIRLQ